MRAWVGIRTRNDCAYSHVRTAKPWRPNAKCLVSWGFSTFENKASQRTSWSCIVSSCIGYLQFGALHALTPIQVMHRAQDTRCNWKHRLVPDFWMERRPVCWSCFIDYICCWRVLTRTKQLSSDIDGTVRCKFHPHPEPIVLTNSSFKI